MKRVFIILLFLSVFSLLSAQDFQNALDLQHAINEQYEYFFWEPVAKAKSYEITIEKYSPESDIWSDYKSETTNECELEILFTPGIYRVSIVSKNILGRKGKASPWVSFQILEENIPYLFDDFLPINKYYNAPVLLLDKNMNASGEIFIQSPEGYSNNTIFIKGKNIFSPNTEVYLVPKDFPEQGGVSFNNYSKSRQTQKLEIVMRNSKQSGIVVSYNPEKLFSGYYSLEIVNVGNNKAFVDVLVLDNSDVAVEPYSGFEVNKSYRVNSVKISNVSDFSIDIKAFGADSSTSFYLEPSEGFFSYAFDTGNFDKRVPLSVLNYEINDGYGIINLTGNAADIHSGYYKLVAEKDNSKKSSFIFLGEKAFNEDYSSDVHKIKSKYNKKDEYIDFTIEDSHFTSNLIYTLVSEYDKESDTNIKIPVSFVSNGKRISAKLYPEDFKVFGKYALIAEQQNTSDVIYISIDNRFRLSTERLSENQVANLFFRPASDDAKIMTKEEDYSSITYKDYEYEMKKRLPYFFSTLSVDLGFLNGSDTYIDLSVDLFHSSFVSLTGNYEYTIIEDKAGQGAYSTLRLQIPSDYFSPYVAVGAGHNFMTGYTETEAYKQNPTIDRTNDFYVVGQVGVVLYTIVDVRYNMIAHNVKFNTKVKPEHTSNISVGFVFPFRDFRFKRNVLSKTAIITTNGTADGTEIDNTKDKIVSVVTKENKSVTGFENNKLLKQAIVSDTTQEVLSNAFKNCINLQQVLFDCDELGYSSSYENGEVPLKIDEDAFAGDININEIFLPKRISYIHPDAFKDWTSGQIIKLAWPSTDTTKGYLYGLKNTNAAVIYSDGKYFNSENINPMLNVENFDRTNHIEPENVSLLYEDKYVLGLRYNGYAFYDYDINIRKLNQISTGEQLLDYLKTGSEIDFKVQGDGYKYVFVIATEDDGYFYHTIKTQEGKVTNEKIVFKKMKKYKFSQVKKLDVNEIKMCAIIPMAKGAIVDASFFKFEVK